jgi:hypothetical protein
MSFHSKIITGTDNNWTITGITAVEGPGSNNNPDNSILISLGDPVSGETYRKAILFTSPGFMSLPLGPGTYDSNGTFTAAPKSPSGAEAVCYVRDDQVIVVATRDTRSQNIPGNLVGGETAVYAPVSQAVSMYKADGSITHYTTSNNTSSGTSVYHTTSPSKILSLFPGSCIMQDETGITLSAGSCSIKLNILTGQIDIIGTIVNVQGGMVSVAGTVATCIGLNAIPQPGVNDALYGPVGIIGIPSTNVFISP